MTRLQYLSAVVGVTGAFCIGWTSRAAEITPPPNAPAAVEWNAATGKLNLKYHGGTIFEATVSPASVTWVPVNRGDASLAIGDPTAIIICRRSAVGSPLLRSQRWSLVPPLAESGRADCPRCRSYSDTCCRPGSDIAEASAPAEGRSPQAHLSLVPQITIEGTPRGCFA